MRAEEKINYGLIGEFLAKCGALEFEVDCFLFAAADQYKERLTSRVKQWPQQATDKCRSLIWLMENLMRFPPELARHGFTDLAELSDRLDRIYHVRNLLCHGAIVQGFGREAGIYLSKATRKPNEAGKFIFGQEFVSDHEMQALISSLSETILLVDAAMFGIRGERGGWLPSDTSGLAPSIKLELISVRSIRDKLALQPETRGSNE